MSIPGECIDDYFLSTLTLANASFSAPLSLKILEFGYSDASPFQFSPSTFQDALCGKLSNVRAIGFHEVWFGEQRIIDDEELEEALYATAGIRAKAAASDGDLAISEQEALAVDLWVYYFDDK